MVVIERREIGQLRSSRGWLLVYGRRKVGKSFIIRRYLNWDLYITVARSRDAIMESDGIRRIELSEALNEAIKVLSSGGTAVIDEFQRLPEGTWDLLASLHPKGRLIAVGSSLGIIKRVFDERSPLLGLLQPFRMDLIRYADAVASLSGRNRALEWGILLRDPWISPFIDLNEDPVEWLCDHSSQLIMSALGLVGEVFTEEERSLTALYDSIMRLLAEGRWRPVEMAGILASRGLLEGGAPAVTGILAKLSSMGLVDRVPLWRSGRSRVYYRHRSPLLSLLLYLEQKYGISDGFKPQCKSAMSAFGKEAEYSIGELLAERLGGKLAQHVSPRGDIDAVILDPKGKRAIAAYEIKLGEITRSEAKKSLERIASLGIHRVGLISLREKPPEVKGVYEVLGPEELIEIAKGIFDTYGGSRGLKRKK